MSSLSFAGRPKFFFQVSFPRRFSTGSTESHDGAFHPARCFFRILKTRITSFGVRGASRCGEPIEKDALLGRFFVYGSAGARCLRIVRQDSNATAMLPSGNRRGGAQTKLCDDKVLVEGETPARGATESRYFTRVILGISW